MNCKIIAEIGINHNGSIDIAKKLINIANAAGCDYVKFQKRCPELCVPKHQMDELRETPWGRLKYIDYRRKIEFGKEEYDQIAIHCEKEKIPWFASVWDDESIEFMSNYTDITKIPSAHITNHSLCKKARQSNSELLLSTGMSTEDEVENAINNCNPDVIFHTNSTYPCPVDNLNLSYLLWLKQKYPDKKIGYSGHEYGLVTTYPVIALGAKYVERHVTMDRNMWGSDQFSSIEPSGIFKLVKGIRDVEKSLNGFGPRIVDESEMLKRKSLRPTIK